jgi:hypothetical protein
MTKWKYNKTNTELLIDTTQKITNDWESQISHRIMVNSGNPEASFNMNMSEITDL